LEGSIDKSDFVVIGKIIKPIGLRGEVLIEPLTFDSNRFLNLKKLWIKFSKEMKVQNINTIRLHKKNIALSFHGYENRDAILPLIGALICIHKSESPKLPKGTYYYYQLENLDVFDVQGQYLGKIFQIMKAGEADVYIVKNEDNRELLVPAIKDSILSIDLEQKKMIVRLLEMY